MGLPENKWESDLLDSLTGSLELPEVVGGRNVKAVDIPGRGYKGSLGCSVRVFSILQDLSWTG